MSHILVIGDESELASAVERSLRYEAYTVTVVETGSAALRAIDRVGPDLIILDLILPQTEGISACRCIRARSDARIIVLAPPAKGLAELLDCEASVDDYVMKPLRPRELMARVKAVFRRARSRAGADIGLLCFSDLRIHPRSGAVENCGRPVKLTPKEFELLCFLATHPGQIFSREQLLYNVWDYDFLGDENTIAVHIRRLRLKIEPNPIQPRHLKTVWGSGYIFEP